MMHRAPATSSRIRRTVLGALVLSVVYFLLIRPKGLLAPRVRPTYNAVAPEKDAMKQRMRPGPWPSHHAMRANATLLMLARNDDVDGAVQSVRRLEDRFNQRHRYSWVFLNDVEFSEDFKARITNVVSGNVEFGVIPEEHWKQPSWIDEERATAGRKWMLEQEIPYADSIPYRNMCRFNSGFFYRHELLASYNYYWRVEPDVDFMCDIRYDPFIFMEKNKKTYSFTIALTEFEETIQTLWETTKDFAEKHPEHIAPDNALGFISDDRGTTYNLCHFWSNFEIADLSFYRSAAYSDYFEYLEAQGGFYYERWGDAPVHSIAAALLLPRDQIHWFGDIGYQHPPYGHCPQDEHVWTKSRCSCDRNQSFEQVDWYGYECKWKFDDLWYQ